LSLRSFDKNGSNLSVEGEKVSTEDFLGAAKISTIAFGEII